MSTSFLGVPLRLLVDCAVGPEHDGEGALSVCLYLGVIVRVRGCQWTAPMRWCRGRGPPLCSWIAVHSCRRPVTQHEIMSTPTLCSVSGSVMCGLHPSVQHAWVMLRSVEASSKASEAIRTGSPLGCLARQPASIYSRVSGTASCCGRHPAGGPGRHHSPVQAGSVHFCQPDTPRIPTCLSRDSQRSHGSPSRQAWRVISAITGFRPFVALGAP